MQVARQYHGRTQVEDCLNPVNGYRGALALQGKKPKNHMKENLKQLKQKQNQVQDKKNEKVEQAKEPFKMKKFANVESRVNSTMGSRPGTAMTRKTEKVNEQFTFQQKQNQYHHHQEQILDLEKENEQPFGDENDATSVNIELPKHKNFGKVPDYIKKYKEELTEKAKWKEEEKKKAKLPPGTKLMDEEERIATLDQLIQNKKEFQTMIEKLPLSMRTTGLVNKRKELEAKMQDIERAITTFSRKYVYVAE